MAKGPRKRRPPPAAGKTPAAAERTALNPAALSPRELAELLTRSGTQPVTPALLAEDVAAGAPTNADGTFHLVHYTAWLAREPPAAPVMSRVISTSSKNQKTEAGAD